MNESAKTEKTAKGRRRGCAALFVLAMIFFGSYGVLFFHDPKTFDDADLFLPPPLALEDPTNGARDLKEALDSWQPSWPLTTLQHFQEHDVFLDLAGPKQFLEEVPAELRDLFPFSPELSRRWELLERAAEKPQISVSRSGFTDLEPMFLLNLVIARVQFAWARGERAEAIDAMLLERELSRRVLDSPSGLHLHWLDQWRVRMGPLWRQVVAEASQPELARLSRALSSSLLPDKWLRDQERLTYQQVSEWLVANGPIRPAQRFGDGIPSWMRSSWFYRPGRTKARLLFLVRNRLAAIEDGRPFPKQPPRTKAQRIISTLLGNPVGEWELDRFGTDDARDLSTRVLVSERLLITLVALRRFELRHGELPTKLAELVPNFLPEVPMNPLREGEQIAYSQDPPWIAALEPGEHFVLEERFGDPSLWPGEKLLLTPEEE